jgi:hypothetical protein
MRKITQQAINAFNNKEIFSKDNTRVDVYLGGETALFLHNNLIATKDCKGVLNVSLAGWATPTTKERLNGLQGVRVCTKKGIHYINDVAVNDNEWVRA